MGSPQHGPGSWSAGLASSAGASSDLIRRVRATAVEAAGRVAALPASERRLRATIESAGVGLATADLEGRLVQATDRMAEIFGRNRDELQREALTDLVADADRGTITDALEM